MVDLPEPERPTSATVFPSGIVKDRFFKAGVSLVIYWKVTLRNSISPVGFFSSRVPVSFSCSISRIANNVWQAAMPRWN